MMTTTVIVELTGSWKIPFTIALGLLYHLKNPFLVLGDLSLRSSFAAVSTRIVNAKAISEKLAAAYLVDNHELGADNTNFWLFNSKGFERLAQRCGWRVLSRVRFGNPEPATCTIKMQEKPSYWPALTPSSAASGSLTASTG